MLIARPLRLVACPGLPDVPRTTTWLRIVRRGDLYTPYTSIDGRRWARGGTWTHDMPRPRIALVSMGGAGRTADFDYVRTYRLERGRHPRGDRGRDARPGRRSASLRSAGPIRFREQLPERR